MLFPLDSWDVGPITGLRRRICGFDVSFTLLSIRERYDLAFEINKVLKSIKTNNGNMLLFLCDPEVLGVVRKLCTGLDCEELFEADMTAQIPVAVTAAEINLDGFFDEPRMMLQNTTHSGVRKSMSKKDHADVPKIGPDVQKYWFLWRPVYSECCTYKEMFVDELFSFYDIHRMHEMLDVKAFGEAASLDEKP
jgi:hypothetical protein